MATYCFQNDKLHSLLSHFEEFSDLPKELQDAFTFVYNDVKKAKDSNTRNFYFKLLKNSKAFTKEYITITLASGEVSAKKFNAATISLVGTTGYKISDALTPIFARYIGKHPIEVSE